MNPNIDFLGICQLLKALRAVGFSENEKCDLDAAIAHLQTMLKQGGFKDYTITLTKDLKKYCEQLKNRSEAQPERNPEKEDEVRVLFYEITL